MARKAKFRVGQVAAFRGVDGSWNYDRIESMRLFDKTAWFGGYAVRRKLKDLRPLTKRERGEPL